MLRFSFLPERYGVYQLAANAALPAIAAGFWSATRIGDELSVVALEGAVPHAVKQQEGWVIIKLHGPFAFTVTGVIAEISRLLADAAVPVFVLSTYDTDYVLVQQAQQQQAREALLAGGHSEVV